MKKNITVLGMPINSGQPKLGTHLGPEGLRDARLIERLRELNYKVTDLGDLKLDEYVAETGNEPLKNLNHVESSCNRLAEAIDKINVKEEFPLILGGDHSMAIGTLTGIAKKYNDLGVVWLDAHGDLNTDETSPSGNIHGMSLAASLGIGAKRLTTIGGYSPKVRVKNAVLIGARDLDEGEIALIKDIGMKVYTMEDIEKLGMDQVMSETFSYLSHCDGVHLSLDVDAFCPKLTPGTGTSVDGGIRDDDALILLSALHQSNMLTSLEVVEVNPLLEEVHSWTALNTVDLVTILFGDTALLAESR